MVFCRYCEENITPRIYLTWKGFIQGLGIFYLIYSITKVPHCPNCNFPMTRRSVVFAIKLPDIIGMARRSVLQLIHFGDRVISASRMSYQNRRFDPFRYFGSINKYQTPSSNMTVNKVRSSISLESYGFRSQYLFRDNQ